MSRVRKFFVVAFLLVATVVGLVAFTSPGDRYFAIAKNLDIFATLFKEVNSLYVDEINPNKAIKTGIDAMLASLDPYTNYIPEDDIEDFRTQSTGQYGGIGAVTSRIDGKIKVVMVMEGFPAQKNGLKIGDELVKIDKVEIAKLSSRQTSNLMKGQANTSVSLTVKRYGTPEPILLSFKREKVKISNVPYFGMLSDSIGYIKLSEFTLQAGKEVKNAVVKLKDQGAKSLILDVRGNPGGLLIEAVNIVNIFIPKGKEVVITKGKIADNNAVYKTLNNPIDTQIPLAVLISSGSASASEIVAGTLQDYDRAVVVGQRSFGKGLVQVTRPLSYNSQLKVTTAKYYTPSGRCIQALDYSHRNPDGSVGKVPDSLKAEFRTSNNRVVYDGGGIDPDVSVDKKAHSPVAYTLYTKGHIFNYATKYYYNHETIAEPEDFNLTNEEYGNFKKWLKGKDFSYTTQMESHLDLLKEKAKKEQYYSEIEADLKKLETTLKESKANDLDDFKDQIKSLLEEEIASRYYFQRGSLEASLKEDGDLSEASKMLKNRAEYKKTLRF